ncbi:hypothetical protein BZA70DRAFT_277873 [Myxozyma melibiosi]|uniref:F-box domain-containing protein n=1 Tax=Myxozyma melibiosi TaxID=54550 RepID=A0ABR1F667_9ASCO
MPKMSDSKPRDLLELLPYEIRLIIIPYLPFPAMRTMMGYSDTWKHLIMSHPRYLQIFEISIPYVPAKTVPDYLAHFTSKAEGIVRISIENQFDRGMEDANSCWSNRYKMPYDESQFELLTRMLWHDDPLGGKRDMLGAREIDRELYVSLPLFLSRYKAAIIRGNHATDLEWHDPWKIMLSDLIGKELFVKYFTTRTVGIDLRVNKWDPEVWGGERGTGEDVSDRAWEIIDHVRMLHVPLDAMTTFFRRVAQNSRKLQTSYLRFSTPPGSSAVTVTKSDIPQFKSSKLGAKIEVLILCPDEDQDSQLCHRPRHVISQKYLSELLSIMPNLQALVLRDFHVLADDDSEQQHEQPMLDLRSFKQLCHVDFSGSEFENGLPLLDQHCSRITLRRSRHLTDLLEVVKSMTGEIQTAGLLQLELSDKIDGLADDTLIGIH